jgi:hypothetical protein
MRRMISGPLGGLMGNVRKSIFPLPLSPRGFTLTANEKRS